MSPKTLVSADTLYRGAWYALEQAGRLLDGAVSLANVEQWSTATGLAMLAREELGRSRLLRRLASKVSDGHAMTPAQVQDSCEDHVEKQRASAMSTTLRAHQDSGLGTVLRQRMSVEPGSAEWHLIDRQLEVVTAAKARRAPKERHGLRMRAFYTDIAANGNQWRRPAELQRVESFEAVVDAINDYAPERDRLMNEAAGADHPEMEAARVAMNPQPVLPLVRLLIASPTDKQGTPNESSAKVRLRPTSPHLKWLAIAFMAGAACCWVIRLWW